MEDPYEILGIHFRFNERTSISCIKNNLKAEWKQYNKKADLSMDEYRKFFDFFEKIDLDEQQKREFLLDQYIYIRYQSELLDGRTSVEELESAYLMIRNPEVRRQYKKIEEQKKAEEFEKELIDETRKTNRLLEIPTITMYSNNMDESMSIMRENKARLDPNNQFKKYTGFPYLWGVKLNKKIENFCLIDGKNVKGEQVIVTKLGEFHFGAMIQKPTKEYPEGKPNMFGNASIIGVTKFDEEGKMVTNDVVVASLNTDDATQNQDFFTSVFVSDEMLEEANKNNSGYIGKISVGNLNGEPVYYINYNWPFSSELVSSLKVAKEQKVNVLIDGKQRRTVENFDILKENLKEIQADYAKKRREVYEKTKKEEEREKIWQK